MHHDPLEVKTTNLTSVKVERPANLLNLLKYLVKTNQASSHVLQVAQTPNGVALLVERRVFVLMVRILEDGEFYKSSMGISWDFHGDIVGSI